MNDQHTHAGYAAHDGNATGSFDIDPLFGNLPGPYEAGHSGQYDNTQWDTGAQQIQHQAAGYDAYAVPGYGQQQYGQYDASGQWPTVDAAGSAAYQQPGDTSGQWDATAWDQQDATGGTAQSGQPDQAHQFGGSQFGYDTPGHPPTVQFDATQFQSQPYGYEATAQWTTPSFDTGAFDATTWNATQDTASGYGSYGTGDATYVQEAVQEPHAARETPEAHEAADQHGAYEDYAAGHEEPDAGPDAPDDPANDPDSIHLAETTTMATLAPPDETPRAARRAPAGGNGSRGRRRTPARRSALLTIAVPSACVMGVAGIAAASVGGLSGGEDTQDDRNTTAAADPTSVKAVAANNKMDTQLEALSADARDFGDRASRTQERIDLKERQEAEKKKRDAEAARKEALRPKFVLPVKQHGLSAYFGQAGVNWMSVHTGIDFPVSYGTPVMAATDGTVRTQWNSAYGNMAIVTSPDGTETWYCHLSSTKIRSGSVKAGDVIAYSGNSGNSTGPHMHFEVRPNAGAAIDPLPWLRSHGLNPE